MKLLPCISLLALGSVVNAQQVNLFTTPTSYPVQGATVVAVADVNGDGFLDIVTANGFAGTTFPTNFPGGQGVSLLLGKGDGTFQAARTLVATGSPTFVVIGDFNNDGKPDLAVANGAASTATVSIMFGNGDGTFQPAIETATNGATSLVAADFNGDGKLDLGVTGTAGGVKVLLGNGDGTFTTGYTSFSSAAGILAADINGDGKLDIIFYGGAYLGIKLGNGDGTFRDDLQVNLQQVTARTAVVGDFNGDGRLDLVIVTPPLGGRGGGSSPFMMFGMPDGSLGQPFLANMIPGSGNTVTADFNGDGKLDTGGAGVPASFSGASLGNGDGQFHFGANGFGERLLINCFAAVGDFDRNGAPDMVVANGQTVDVALNTGGHPPLLSSLFLFQPSATGALTIARTVPGGGPLSGNVYLGGPAPVGGTVITLSSSDLSAFFPGGNTVTIPAGAQVAAFGISTTTVGVPTLVTITASSGVATASSTVTLIPAFTFTSFSVDQTSLFGLLGFGVLGGNPAVGTVTFNNPAGDGVVVALSSSNPAALKVPASVSVPRGATTATFTLGAWPVKTDTPVVVTATSQGNTFSTTVTVKKNTPTVVVTKASYDNAVGVRYPFSIEANVTDGGFTVQVYDAITGAFAGQLTSAGSGKYIGRFSGPKITSAVVQSSGGGMTTTPIAQK